MDFTMRAGESLVIDSAITNSDGTVRDITAASLTFKVYLSPSKPDDSEDNPVVITGTSEVVSGPLGAVQSYLVQSDTVDMPFRVLYYEVVLYETDGTTTVIESGKLVIGIL